MAANVIEAPTTHQQLECIVNRWLVDYYFFLAIDAVRNDKYSEFCGVRDVLERLLYRPLECTEVMPSKIRVLQFLSRINDGEKLDLAFESDDSVTPLESAVEVLTTLRDVCSISQEDLEKVCTSVKEMLVVICLKNGEFEKAKEILIKSFPCGMVGNKAILMGLANQRVKSHDILEQTNFKKFKEDMVNFCVQLFPTSEPFLYKAAKQLVDKRLVDLRESSNQGAAPVEDEAYLADTSMDNALVCWITRLTQDQFIQKKRLMAAYTALSKKTTFSKLEEEEHDSKDHTGGGKTVCHAPLGPGRFSQVDSGCPREACVVGQQPVNGVTYQSHCASSQGPVACKRPRRLYTLAQLVQERDSQEPDTDVDMLPKVEGESHAAGVSMSEATKRPVTPNSPQELQGRVPCPSRQWAAAVSEDSDLDILNPNVDRQPVRRPRKRKSTISIKSCDGDDEEEDHLSIMESSGPTPQKTSSPKKDKTKGKLLDNARESKEMWSEEESLFEFDKGQKTSTNSGSSNGKKLWSEKESNILKEAVARFGEGNWAKIMAKYTFENRTNVNLKDRWRTMKRLKLV